MIFLRCRYGKKENDEHKFNEKIKEVRIVKKRLEKFSCI